MQFFTGISLFLSKVSPAWNRWRVDEHWKKKTRLYVDNQWSLSEDQKGNIDAFWGRYCKVDDLFHRFYSQKTGVFDVRYIPDHVYYNIIDKFYNPEQLAKNLDDKSLYESILVDREGVIKHPETIAIKSGGYWLTHKFEPISEPEVMKRIKDSQEVFVKASVDSCGGKGVQYLNTADESGNSILNILKMGGGNIVIQNKIIQSAIVAQLNPSSVNTLRVLSFLSSEGEVKIYSIVLRMGLTGAVVDNASSGGITVGVRDDGRLKSKAFKANGVCFDKVHPDSKVEFESVVIPCIKEIKDSVKRLHYRLPRLRLLSWDFAIDEKNQPVLIEVNMNMGQLDFHQLNNGPLFGEDTEMILNEVFGKNK